MIEHLPENEKEVLVEVYRVLHAVNDLDVPDPPDLRKLYLLLKLGRPDELEYVTVERVA